MASKAGRPRMPTKIRRASILNAARRAIREMGFGNCTMDQIAHNASMSKRALYTVFSSKEDILTQLFLSTCCGGRALSAIYPISAEGLTRLLYDISAIFISADNIALLRITLCEPGLLEKCWVTGGISRIAPVQELSSWIRRHAHERQREQDVIPEELSALLMGMMIGNLMFKSSWDSGLLKVSDADRQQVAVRCSKIFLSGWYGDTNRDTSCDRGSCSIDLNHAARPRSL